MLDYIMIMRYVKTFYFLLL